MTARLSLHAFFAEAMPPDQKDWPFPRNAASIVTVVLACLAAKAAGTNATSASAAMAAMLMSFLIVDPLVWSG